MKSHRIGYHSLRHPLVCKCVSVCIWVCMYVSFSFSFSVCVSLSPSPSPPPPPSPSISTFSFLLFRPEFNMKIKTKWKNNKKPFSSWLSTRNQQRRNTWFLVYVPMCVRMCDCADLWVRMCRGETGRVLLGSASSRLLCILHCSCSFILWFLFHFFLTILIMFHWFSLLLPAARCKFFIPS